MSFSLSILSSNSFPSSPPKKLYRHGRKETPRSPVSSQTKYIPLSKREARFELEKIERPDEISFDQGSYDRVIATLITLKTDKEGEEAAAKDKQTAKLFKCRELAWKQVELYDQQHQRYLVERYHEHSIVNLLIFWRRNWLRTGRTHPELAYLLNLVSAD